VSPNRQLIVLLTEVKKVSNVRFCQQNF